MVGGCKNEIKDVMIFIKLKQITPGRLVRGRYTSLHESELPSECELGNFLLL